MSAPNKHAGSKKRSKCQSHARDKSERMTTMLARGQDPRIHRARRRGKRRQRAGRRRARAFEAAQPENRAARSTIITESRERKGCRGRSRTYFEAMMRGEPSSRHAGSTPSPRLHGGTRHRRQITRRWSEGNPGERTHRRRRRTPRPTDPEKVPQHVGYPSSRRGNRCRRGHQTPIAAPMSPNVHGRWLQDAAPDATCTERRVAGEHEACAQPGQETDGCPRPRKRRQNCATQFARVRCSAANYTGAGAEREGNSSAHRPAARVGPTGLAEKNRREQHSERTGRDGSDRASPPRITARRSRPAEGAPQQRARRPSPKPTHGQQTPQGSPACTLVSSQPGLGEPQPRAQQPKERALAQQQRRTMTNGASRPPRTNQRTKQNNKKNTSP